MKYLAYVLQIVLQCTWGIVQTLIGFVFFVIYRKAPHFFYKGTVQTKCNSPCGLSMGLFIFTPNEECSEIKQCTDGTPIGMKNYADMVTVHEYGHAIQSIILGPFAIIPGIVSVAWGRMKRYEILRQTYGVPYSFCWVEHWADWLGEKATGHTSIGNA